MNIKIVRSPASRSVDVIAATKNILDKVDAIFINNDNTALASVEAIASAASPLPVFVSDIDAVEKGALAALGANQREIGYQTAEIVLNILLKNKVIKDIPVQTPKVVEKKVNEEVVKKLGLQFLNEAYSRVS